MLKYIFKSATGSFSRTIGRILAYIAICAAILFLGSFLNILNVKAAGEVTSFTYNTIFGTNIDSYVQFKDLKTGAVYGSDVKRYGTGGGENAIGYWWAYHSLPNNYSTSAEGIAISSCSNSFVENNYYSILSYYIVTDNFFVHNTYAKDSNIGLGDYWVYSFDHRNISPSSYFSGVSNSYITGNLWLTFNTITFKANSNSNCVSWTVNKSGGGLNSSNFQYVGSRILHQGTEPPSNSEVTSLITQEINKINQNIDSMKEKQDETNNKLDDVNNNITNDKVDGAQGSANDFFNNFEDKDYGFSDIIKIPLETINKVTSGVCTPVSLPIPFVDTSLTLPCMSGIYNEYFGGFYSIYKVVTFGIIAYYVCINIFAMVKNFKNPDSDEIEVFEL